MYKDDISLDNERVTTTSCVLNINNNVNLWFDMRTTDSATRVRAGNNHESEFNEDND